MAQIKKDTSLRKAILQAAITGQLISDVKGTTETGKQLLDRIIEERNNKLIADWEEALKKNPKAKKPATIVASEIDEDEIPFEIPENWYWCRLGDLVAFGECKNAEPNEIDDDSWILDLEDIEKDSGLILQFKTKKEVDSKSTKHIFKKGYVLYSKLRPYLNKCVIAPKDGYCTSEILPLNFGRYINNKYIQKFLMSPYFVDYTDSLSFGVKMPRLGTGDGKKALVPLPPLSVQNAIIEKLEQVLPLVDAYENAVLQKEELKTSLPDKVKKAILQEAITGQLTETWRKTVNITENGKQLLDRIIAERNEKALTEWEEALKKNPKAKKPVAVVTSEIDEDDIPFEVPESWFWCRLGDVCTKLVDGDHNPPAGLPMKTEYIMASSQNINDDTLVDLEKVRYLSKEVFEVENERTKAEKGDIFFTSVGTLGRSCVFDGSKNICFQRSVSVLRTVIYNKFLKYCLDAPFIQFFIVDNATGTAQKGFYLNQLAKLVIPLPPLEEQNEIVKKVEELIPLCKNIGE